MASVVIALLLAAAIISLPFIVSFAHHRFHRREIMASITDAATAIEAAATSLNTAAQGLAAAATAIGTLNDTSALDTPLADLAGAVSAIQTAADAVQAAVTPSAQP